MDMQLFIVLLTVKRLSANNVGNFELLIAPYLLCILGRLTGLVRWVRSKNYGSRLRCLSTLLRRQIICMTSFYCHSMSLVVASMMSPSSRNEAHASPPLCIRTSHLLFATTNKAAPSFFLHCYLSAIPYARHIPPSGLDLLPFSHFAFELYCDLTRDLILAHILRQSRLPLFRD
jgi:hypothetical protein